MGKKGWGQRRRKWEDLFPPPPLDLNARNLFSNSSTCSGGKNRTGPSHCHQECGAPPKAAKEGLQGFPRKIFEKKANPAFWAHLALFQMKLCFRVSWAEVQPCTPNYTSTRYAMAQVSGAREHGVQSTCTKHQTVKNWRRSESESTAAS